MENTTNTIKPESLDICDELLEILLMDRTTKKHIIWGTNNYYKEHGLGFSMTDQIEKTSIRNHRGFLIKPRIQKSKKEQSKRAKNNAEVFTPSWICNKQNNLIDNLFFGKVDVFNVENGNTWKTNENPIDFSLYGKSWKEYVLLKRLEITCGEAPYLVSRYDTVTGEFINTTDRIGLLDRKIRVINENVDDASEWMDWLKKAYQSVYGYDYQGDNVLIARVNLLLTFVDYYKERFGCIPIFDLLKEIATIVSWNIWQMDGLKFVVPNSCHKEEDMQLSLFGDNDTQSEECKGCRTNNIKLHNGIYCRIMNWDKKRSELFIDSIEG